MDLEAVADELYGLDRDEFIAVRDERAARARAEGDKDLAGEIRALRKPTSAAWLVNRFVRERPKDVGRLTELGDSLRQAHTELAGEQLRALSRQRHELVQALTDQATGLPGAQVSESVTREVYETLDAALADPEAGRALAEGRLTTALQPGDAFSGGWLPTESPPRTEPRKTEPDTAKPDRPGKPEPDRKKADAAAAERAEKAARAERAAAERREKREKLRQAREEAARARGERDEARRELRSAEREEVKARKRTESARQALDAAEARVVEAEEAVGELS